MTRSARPRTCGRFDAARIVPPSSRSRCQSTRSVCTSNALDEAAFLILHTLSLPIDQLDPWLDARLTRSEREAVYAVIQARILTRKPAPYLTNAAYIGGHRFYVDERVIVPRSYIGELLVHPIGGEYMFVGVQSVEKDHQSGWRSAALRQS